MSFNDLERDAAASTSNDPIKASPHPARPKSSIPLPLYHAPGGSSSLSPQDDDANEGQGLSRHRGNVEQLVEIKKLTDGIGAQIFKINSNTAAINKLLKLAESRSQDRSAAQESVDRDWTKRAHNLVESTRAVIKATTPTLKQLSDLIVTKADGSPQCRLALSKLQRDFESAFQAFSFAQKRSAKRSKDDLAGAKRAIYEQTSSQADQKQSQSSKIQQLVEVEELSEASRLGQEDGSEEQAQEQEQEHQVKLTGPSAADLEFQEALIAEREAEIREIESGVHELNEIFRDLGQIVQEQGGMIDNIEYNIGEIAINTDEANRELVRADEYQRKAGKRAACLMLIVGLVISAVLVAILS